MDADAGNVAYVAEDIQRLLQAQTGTRAVPNTVPGAAASATTRTTEGTEPVAQVSVPAGLTRRGANRLLTYAPEIKRRVTVDNRAVGSKATVRTVYVTKACCAICYGRATPEQPLGILTPCMHRCICEGCFLMLPAPARCPICRVRPVVIRNRVHDV
jgi:hypothetical protein